MITLEKSYDQYAYVRDNPDLLLREGLSALQTAPNHHGLLNQVAFSYYYLHEFYDALTYVHRIQVLSPESVVASELFFTLQLAGDLYRKLDLHTQALRFYMEALQLPDLSQKEEKKCLLLRRMALVHCECHQMALALSCGEESHELAHKLKDPTLLADIHLTLSTLFIQERQWDLAIDALIVAIDAYKQLKHSKGQILSYLNMAMTYEAQKNHNLAHVYYNKAMTLSKEVSYTYGLIQTSYYMANLYLTSTMEAPEKSYLVAQLYVEEGLRLAHHYPSLKPKIALYYLLSAIYEQQSKYELALSSYKAATEIKDALYAKRMKEQLHK